jgi:hypothetical protein
MGTSDLFPPYQKSICPLPGQDYSGFTAPQTYYIGSFAAIEEWHLNVSS